MMKATDYADRLRDTETERTLAADLRRMAEPEAYRFIVEMLDVNLIVGLDLAGKRLRSRPLLRGLLERGLRTADASSIRFWMESIGRRLGVRGVVRLLHEHLDTDPVAVRKAAYFLPSLVAGGSDVERELVNGLEAALGAKQKAAV